MSARNDKKLNSSKPLKVWEEMREYIDDDIEELTEYDRLVLCILAHEDSCKVTRLQKTGLIVNSIIEGKIPASHGPYYFGGFSDDIEAAIIQLTEDGLVMSDSGNRFALTTYGKEVMKHLDQSDEPDVVRLAEACRTIADAFGVLSDQDVTALTYLLFPELTSDSLIKERIARRVRSKKIKGVSVYQFHRKNLDEFLSRFSSKSG